MKNFKRIIIFSFILVTFFFSPLASSLGNSILDQKSPKEAPLNSSFVKFMRSTSKTTYGYIPPTFDTSHLKRLVPNNYNLNETLPDKFDWRMQNKVTPVKNQSPYSDCWIFATTSVLESKVLIDENVSYDFSEASVAISSDKSFTYLFDGVDKDGKKQCEPGNTGGWIQIAVETFIRRGAKLETCLPYNSTDLCCGSACYPDSCPAVKRVNGYRIVTYDGTQIDLIKNAIYNYGPLTMSFYENEGKYDDPQYGVIYDLYPCSKDTTHAVSVVGWDDNVPHKDPNHPGKGAWIAKNSWGTNWGNNGYFYLAYGSNNTTEFTYLLYENYNTNDVLYTWDESSMLGSMGYNDNDAWMASVYKAQAPGQLKKIEFWVPSPNASYQFYIYDGSFGSKLLSSGSGTLQEAGYYSVPLSNSVDITQGQQFTLTVKLKTPGYNYPIPIEEVVSGVNPKNPLIQQGVTFAKNNDSDAWQDTANKGWNVCLRAMVETKTSPPVYAVTTNVSPLGSGTVTLSPAGGTYTPGTTVTLTAVPYSGYHFVSWSGDITGTDNPITITMDSDKTITANFALNTYTITASAGGGGTITPSGSVTVNSGEAKTFIITPDTGYKIKDVKVDGVSVGAVSSYTFTNITSNHTIEAIFEKQTTQIVIILRIGNTNFTVNGETRILDSPPIIKNGRTLLPIRAIVEALGGSVTWHENEKSIDIVLGNNHLILQIGNPNAYVNGIQKFIDPSNLKVVPEIINGRTMLPLRFVAENLGAKVDWESVSQTVTVTYPEG